MDQYSPKLILAGQEIIKKKKYDYDAQYLQQKIASLLASPDAALEFHPTVLSQLRDISDQLSRLLEDPADDADVSLSIYDQNFEIIHISGNERKSLYSWSYGTFRCEIGPRERRLLLLMIQQHPASLKLCDYTRDQVYSAYNTLCEKGFGEVFEMPQKGYLRFKEYSEGSQDLSFYQNGEMSDTPSSSREKAPKNERVDTSFASITLRIKDTLYDIKRLYTIDTYSISRKGRASTHIFQVRKDTISYLRNFLDGKQIPMNPHYNRELEKIGFHIVRMGGTHQMELTINSPLSKLSQKPL